MPFDRRLLWIAACLYAMAWIAHLILGTLTLHGFHGDGALAFLIHLSNSYVFNKPDNLIHLFSVGLPRDAQLLLNALSLQAALWLRIKDPAVFKYAFVFWQYALPGLLYLLLFFALWRNKKLSWAIFPLISWAIVSVSVDMNAVNSTRWAIPIFWMHFFLMLLAGPRLRFWPVIGVLLTGAAMWGGLYESVVLHCGLCCAVGITLWIREKNKIPLLYALAAIPGACRAALSFITIGHSVPNTFHMFGLPHLHEGYYCFLISLTLCLIVAAAVLPKRKLPRMEILWIFIFYVLIGVIVIIEPLPDMRMQFAMRFDYVLLSMALMVWAGTLRIWQLSPSNFAVTPAILALLTGSVLWTVQAEQSVAFHACLDDYDAHRGNQPLLVGDPLLTPLIQLNDKIGFLDKDKYERCTWDHHTAWAHLLLDAEGEIRQWPLFSYWQNFEFVEKNGQMFLHTNNWTLIFPSIQTSAADLPLKTPFYDLAPLYKELGPGPFVTRVRCLDVSEISNPFWRAYYVSLDDNKRRLMSVCPR